MGYAHLCNNKLNIRYKILIIVYKTKDLNNSKVKLDEQSLLSVVKNTEAFVTHRAWCWRARGWVSPGRGTWGRWMLRWGCRPCPHGPSQRAVRGICGSTRAIRRGNASGWRGCGSRRAPPHFGGSAAACGALPPMLPWAGRPRNRRPRRRRVPPGRGSPAGSGRPSAWGTPPSP